MKEKIKDLIAGCRTPSQEYCCQIQVRRLHVFTDFKNFFNKKWNQKRKENKIVVTFVGEAGVDTGGPLRELFSCKCILL